MNNFQLIYTLVFFTCSILYTGYKINKLSEREPEIVNRKIDNSTMKRIEI